MLTLENISYRYDRDPVLSDIDLSIEQGEILCLLGESGSGKTTLLRVIAGLEADIQGRVLLNDEILNTIPAHKRGFGLMFQDFALFPHLTVAQNVVFGLKMQGVPSDKQQEICDEMLQMVDLDGYQARDVDTLSGGQKQRVALARSLAPRPKLLMLDEPLGSLDTGLRQRLVVELRQIIKQVGLTAIYVTHDQQEAFAIADRVAVMNRGRVIQLAPPETLYFRPQSTYVANFLGLTNIVSADFLEQYASLTTSAPAYLIQENSLSLHPDGALRGTILERTFQGQQYRLRVEVDSVVLTLNVSSLKDVPEFHELVHLHLDNTGIVPLDE